MTLTSAEVYDELEQDYRPIRDYALIGDCHGAALVSRHGSIDWCCLRRFDADPIFCRILDARIGGYFSMHPVEATSVTRGYLRDSNILETRFTTKSGTAVVTDFMPVGRKQGSGTHNYVDLAAPDWVVRIVEVANGAVELEVQYRPTIMFGRERAELRVGTNCLAVEGGPFFYHAFPTSRLKATGRRHASSSSADNACSSLSPRRQSTALISLAFKAAPSGTCRLRALSGANGLPIAVTGVPCRTRCAEVFSPSSS